MPTYLSKLSNIRAVPSLNYLGSPSQAVQLTTSPVSELSRFTFPTLQLMTVIALSCLGSRFEAVQLALHFTQLFVALFVTWRNIRCSFVFSVVICSHVTCTEVSEVVQLPQNRWQIMCYDNCIPFLSFYTLKILSILSVCLTGSQLKSVITFLCKKVSNSGMDMRFFLLRNLSDCLWGPPRLLFSG